MNQPLGNFYPYYPLVCIWNVAQYYMHMYNNIGTYNITGRSPLHNRSPLFNNQGSSSYPYYPLVCIWNVVQYYMHMYNNIGTYNITGRSPLHNRSPIKVLAATFRATYKAQHSQPIHKRVGPKQVQHHPHTAHAILSHLSHKCTQIHRHTGSLYLIYNFYYDNLSTQSDLN